MGRIWCPGRTLIALGALGLLTFGCDQANQGSDANATEATVAVEAAAQAKVDETPTKVDETPAEVKAEVPPAAKPKPAATTKAPDIKSATQPPTTAPAVPDEPAASTTIRFDKKEHDFGRMSDTDTGRCTFPFVNTGLETLIIKEVKTSCGCTAATLKKMEYAPGEGAELDVTFDPKGQGKQAKTITIVSNAESNPERLTIRADVVAFVTLDPKYLRLGDLPIGKAHRETLTVTSTDPHMTIEKVTASGRFLTAELVGERPGVGATSLYEVAVTIGDDAPWGGFNGSIAITCKGRPSPDAAPIEHIARASVIASIFGDIKADQTMFRLSVVPPGGSFEKTIRLTRASGDAFQILSSEVTRSTMPGVTVVTRPIEGSSGHELVLSGSAGDFLGSVNGEVKITTDVPGESEMSFRFGGIVRAR